MAYGSANRGRGSGRLPVLLGLALSLGVLFVSRGGAHATDSVARSGLEDGAAPVLSYLSMPFRGVETFVGDQQARRRALAENRSLKDELRRLQDIERERDLLRRKLDAVAYHMILPPEDGYSIVLARAVSETRGPFAQAALVNAGRDDGVRIGAAVASTKGLYGHILRVGDTSARVLRLTDPESRIPVKNVRTEARAILRGDGTSRPLITYIDDPEDFADGDLLRTSGDEGVMPEGLRVGTVRVRRDADATRVDLAETGRTADWIRIYVREPIVPPEDDDLNTVMRVKTIVIEKEPEIVEAAEPGSTIGGVQ